MGCIDENNVYEEYGLRKNSVKLKKLKDMLIQCGEEALCYLCKRNKSGKKGKSFFTVNRTLRPLPVKLYFGGKNL